MAAMPPLSPWEYMAWVQRSFNRILGQSEVTDGADTTTYRDLIELFQRDEDLAVTRSIYPVDQNRIIQRNHADPGYMTWVRNALRGLGFSDPSDKQAIIAFQKSVGLGSDGWLGAQTEVAMIAKVKTYPPGHRTKPRDRPKPPPRGLSMLERFLMTDTASAMSYAPALIEPFPHSVASSYRTEEKIRQRLAAAVRAARMAHLRLSAMGSKSDLQLRWNDANEAERIWFGDFSQMKYRKVLSTFAEIAVYLADRRLKVIGDTQETGYARALPSIRKIHLGMAWITPGKLTLGGPDPERVQTFVHEAAHIAGRFSSDEGDHYGPDSAKELADETMRATRNADNYGYYAIHVALHAR